MAKKRSVRNKVKRRRGRGGTSTRPGARPAEADPMVRNYSSGGATSAPSDDPWLAQQREIERLQGLIDRALELHQAGQVAEAEGKYRAILAEDPAHFDALRLLAAARLGQGDPAQAVEYFDQAATAGPLDAAARSNMAYAFKELGRFDDAIDTCVAVLDADPNFLDARFNLAAAYLEAGRFEEAGGEFQTVVQTKPELAEGWYNLGRALTGQGLHAESVAHYERSVELAPTNVNFLLRLGMAQQNSGDQWAAARIYDRVLALDGDNETAHFLLGHAQYDQGYMHEAIAAYRKAVEINPRYVEALSNLGSVLRRVGEPEESRAAYLQASEVAPQHVPAHFNLANLDREYGRYRDAEQGYRRAIELEPGHFGAHVNLSSSLLELGRPDAAAQVGRAAVAIPGTPDPELGWQALASALLAAGDVDGALQAWDSAYEAKGDDRFNLCAALATPVVLESAADRDEVAEAMGEGIDDQMAALARMTPVVKALDVCPADLSGHGRDDHELLGRLEALLRGLDEELHLVAGHCHHARSNPGAALRIGLVSARFDDPDDGLLALGLAKRIPRERASVHGMSLGQPRSELGQAVLRACDESKILPRDFIMARNSLCEASLDVVLHVGVSRNSVGYGLGFIRAARVQAGLGAEGDAGLSTLRDADLPSVPLFMERPGDSPEMGADGPRRYVCSRPLRDVTPEFDAPAAAILEADPDGVLVIRSHNAKFADGALRARLQGAGVPEERLLFEPADDVTALSALFVGASVILEPPGHGRLPTTALAVGSGRPVLAMEGAPGILPGVTVVEAAAYAARAVELAAGAPGANHEAESFWGDDAAVIGLIDALEEAVGTHE